MNEYSKLATDKIAVFLKATMLDKGITANQILVKGKMNKKQVYSVLKMGAFKDKNYTIDTFLQVCRFIGVHLEFHDLSEKSNFDLLPENKKPSKN